MLRAARTMLKPFHSTSPPPCNRIVCTCIRVPPEERDYFWWNVYRVCYTRSPGPVHALKYLQRRIKTGDWRVF